MRSMFHYANVIAYIWNCKNEHNVCIVHSKREQYIFFVFYISLTPELALFQVFGLQIEAPGNQRPQALAPLAWAIPSMLTI